MKGVLRFSYWQKISLEGEEDVYEVYFKLKLPTGGTTDISANSALAKGYLLDPETPTLKDWLEEKKNNANH